MPDRLEKEVITYAAAHGASLLPQVRPTQLHGIEINAVAQQLAQVVIWIGYLQWKHDNGFPAPRNPVLDPIESIRLRDAIMDLTDVDNPKEPIWPTADFIIGIAHSRLHAIWAERQGTQVRERESGFRYTPTTCFETFPLPESSDSQLAIVGEAGKELDLLRSNWLNPAEWLREQILEFPGSVSGPWGRYVERADSRGIGMVRYRRFVPKDEGCAKQVGKRTLTNLYNQRPAWLDHGDV